MNRQSRVSSVYDKAGMYIEESRVKKIQITVSGPLILCDAHSARTSIEYI